MREITKSLRVRSFTVFKKNPLYVFLCRGFFLIVIAFSLSSSYSSAETLTLKNGKVVSGIITQKTARFIKIDPGVGVSVTYYLDEIDRIDNASSQASLDTETGHDRSFLWEVVSGDSHVFLLGSIHLAKESMYPLKEPIETAFKKSEYLAVEVDLVHGDQMAIQAMMLEKAFYPPGDTLQKHLSKETLSKLEKVLPKYGLDVAIVSNFKPWYVSLYLSLLQIKNLGFSEDYGLDRYFLRRFRNVEKIVQLETIESQVDLFEKLPNQDLLLEYTLVELAQTEKMMSQLIRGWAAGDSVGLEKILLSDPLRQYPKLLPIYQKLLFDRNEVMTQEIDGFLQSGKNYFVVVGAGQLVGDEGIISLLKKKGYRVEQR